MNSETNMAAVCSMCTGTLYHTDPKSKAFGKRTHRLEAKSMQGLKQQRIGGKIRNDVGTKKDQETRQARTKVEKH